MALSYQSTALRAHSINLKPFFSGGLLMAVAAVCLCSSRAQAHDAKSGWSYAFSCCSGYDCREVREPSIRERPEGYVSQGNGEVVGYHDVRRLCGSFRFSPQSMVKGGRGTRFAAVKQGVQCEGTIA